MKYKLSILMLLFPFVCLLGQEENKVLRLDTLSKDVIMLSVSGQLEGFIVLFQEDTADYFLVDVYNNEMDYIRNKTPTSPNKLFFSFKKGRINEFVVNGVVRRDSVEYGRNVGNYLSSYGSETAGLAMVEDREGNPSKYTFRCDDMRIEFFLENRKISRFRLWDGFYLKAFCTSDETIDEISDYFKKESISIDWLNLGE